MCPSWRRESNPQSRDYKSRALPLGHASVYKATFLNQLSKIADVCDICCQSPLCNWWRIWVTIPSELLLARQTTTPCSPIPHISKPPGSRLPRFPTVHLMPRRTERFAFDLRQLYTCRAEFRSGPRSCVLVCIKASLRCCRSKSQPTLYSWGHGAV